MPRIMLFVLAWLAVTTAAVGVAWAGVQIVSTRVVEPLPPEALAVASGSAGPGATPTDDPGTAAAPPTPAAAVPTPSAEATTPSVAATPGPTAGESSSAEPGPTEGPRTDLRSYRVVGGSVTLRFAPGAVTVVAAVPVDDDFDLDLSGNGTTQATVEFESDDHRFRVRGWWDDGPVDRVDEDERDSSGRGDGDDGGDDGDDEDDGGDEDGEDDDG